MANSITLPAATITTAGITPAIDKQILDSILPSAGIAGGHLTDLSLSVVASGTAPALNIIETPKVTVSGTLFELLEVSVWVNQSDSETLSTAAFLEVSKSTDSFTFGVASVVVAQFGQTNIYRVGMRGRLLTPALTTNISSNLTTGTVDVVVFSSASMSLAVPPVGTEGSGASGNGAFGAAGGTDGQVLAVNSDEEGVEWIDAPDGVTNLGLAGTNATNYTVTSSTGTGVTLPPATASLAGLQTAADKTKLDGIATGAQVNVAPDLDSLTDVEDLDDGTAGQVLALNSAEDGVEWVDQSGGGGAAASVVAYSARGANQSSWYTSSWGQWSGSLTSSVNDGSFTLSTDTNQKVIVPEDGVYEVAAVMYLNANNDDSGGTDFRPMLRIRRERSGSSTINLGQESGAHIRGNADDEGSRGTVTAVAVADLEDGDEIYTDARAWRQSSGTNATVSLDISLVKIGGAKGDAGATTFGALTDLGNSALGDAGQVLTVNSGETAAEWADATGGSGVTNLFAVHSADSVEIRSSTGNNATITGPTFSTAGVMTSAQRNKLASIAAGAQVNVTPSFDDLSDVEDLDDGDAGQVLALNSAEDGVEWVTQSGGSGTTNLAVASRDSDSLEVTSSTGTNAEIPSATGTLAGLMPATDQVKLNAIEANSTADQTDAEIKTAYENNSDTNAFTDDDEDKLDDITPRASMAGSELRAITFEIVSTTPDAEGEILAASGNDLSSLVVFVANEDAGVADSQAIVIREELAGSIVVGKTGEFIVTGRTVSAVGTDSARITFTGHLSAETSIDQGLNTFSLGSVGLDVRLHFLHKESATTYLPSWGTANTPLGYDADGVLGEIDFPEEAELPGTIGTDGQVLTVASGAVAWEDTATELPDTLGTAGQVLEVNSDADGVEWSTVAAGNLPALGDARQILTINEDADGTEWTTPIVMPPVNNISREVTYLAPGADFTTDSQIRQNASGTVSFSSYVGGSKYAIQASLVVGDQWQLRLNSDNYNIYRITARTQDTFGSTGGYSVYTLTVDLLRTEGSFSSASTGDALRLNEYTGLVPAPQASNYFGVLSNNVGFTYWTTLGAQIALSGTSASLYVDTLATNPPTPGIIPGPDADDAGLVPAVGTAGQVLTVNSGATGVEWGGVVLPDTLGDAGQVLTVNSGETAPEWATPDKAYYYSGWASVSITGDSSYANRALLSSGPINVGSFTTRTVSSASRIVIPSDGNYQLTFAVTGDANTQSSGGSNRSALLTRIRRARSGASDINLGVAQSTYSRGQYGEPFSRGSATNTAIAALEEDDEIWLDVSVDQQSNSDTMLLTGNISIVKL